MSWSPCPDPVPGDRVSADAIEMLIIPRAVDLGEMQVRRALPSAKRQMVGPFIFFDQMGPAQFLTDQGIDVRPHPHINLATVTYHEYRSCTGTVSAPRRPSNLVRSTGCRPAAASFIPSAPALSGGGLGSACSESRPGWLCPRSRRKATQHSSITAQTNCRRWLPTASVRVSSQVRRSAPVRRLRPLLSGRVAFGNAQKA